MNWDRRIAHTRSGSAAAGGLRDWLPEVIDLLRSKTTYDFTLYKPGTLQRRIERRMVLANIKAAISTPILKFCAKTRASSISWPKTC